MSLSDSELSQWGKVGAHASWAKTTDRSARTKPARDAFEQKFLDAAGGDPKMAAHLRKAYFARLAAKSARARRGQGGGNPPGSKGDRVDSEISVGSHHSAAS